MLSCIMPAVGAAIEIGLFNVLAEEPATIEELAVKLKLSPAAVETLTTTLGHLGLVANDACRFTLTLHARIHLVGRSHDGWGSTFRQGSPASSATEQMAGAWRRDKPVPLLQDEVLADGQACGLDRFGADPGRHARSASHAGLLSLTRKKDHQ